MTIADPTLAERLRAATELLEWLASDPECQYRFVDGSMVFVDISGFTKLSERLARKGRPGHGAGKTLAVGGSRQDRQGRDRRQQSATAKPA